jgi:chemotaxis response regulator CheB
MPKEAIKLAAAERVMPLGQIAQALMSWGAG